MKRDWINGIVAGLLGMVFTSIGIAALFHGAAIGALLMSAGVFLLLSAYAHLGYTFKNPAVKQGVQIFGLIVVGCTILVTFAAGTALATRTGVWAFEQMIQGIQEHFWLSSALLVSLAWTLIFRPKEKI
jgi:hypothetical protein